MFEMQNKQYLLLFFILHRPDLFDYDALSGQGNISNLDHAFTVAQDKLGIKRILDPQGKLF